MRKYVTTLLLDREDNYVYDDGSLPERPSWDKDLLKTFVENESISKIGYNMLPRSLQSVTHITPYEPYPITIPEIDALAGIIIITRSYGEPKKGKRFRFDKFEKVLKTGQLEIWKRR